MSTLKWLNRSALVLGALAAVALAALALLQHLADRKMARQVDVRAATLTLRHDPDTLARGQYLFASRGCTECHGQDGAGRTFVRDDDQGLVLRAPNITPAGSAVRSYQVADWARTIRHGVKPDGHPVQIMPSEDYARWTDEDMAALISHLQQMPAVQGDAALVQLPAIVKALYALGMVQDAAEKIDHSLPPPVPVPAGATVAHGRYVAQMCIGCHGAGFSGGRIPGGPPDWPAAANLTPGARSAMGPYRSPAQLGAMFKTGRRPDGTAVSPVMPFGALQALNDTDIAGLHAYLQSLPAQAFGQR